MANNADILNRIVAIIIDTIILWIVMAVLSLPFGLQAIMMNSVSDPMAAAGMWASTSLLALLSAVVTFGYFVYFEGSTGQTIGKKIVKIKVVRQDGKPMTYVDSLIRTILRIIDGIGFYLIGLIVVLASKDKQRIGDMAAKTLVVKA